VDRFSGNCILRGAVFGVLVLFLSSTSFAIATPPVSTPEIEAVQESLEQAEAKLREMNDSLSESVEEYNTVSAALEETRRDVNDAAEEVRLSRAEVDLRQKALASRATEIYKRGDSGLITVLLGTKSFQDFLSRVELCNRLAQRDSEILAELKVAKARTEEAHSALAARESEEAALQSELESRRMDIEMAIAQQEEYAASLDTEVKTLIAEEEERQRILEEERAREAAEELARQKAAEEALLGVGSVSLDGPGRTEVVGIALKCLGVPYVWGGSSPSPGFDCSGLVQYVYAQVGIALPRNSAAQFVAGSRVSANDVDGLVLGDLVFFGYDGDLSRVHHVGIYCGNGNFIHAPYTGEFVKVSSLLARIAISGDYVGASRF